MNALRKTIEQNVGCYNTPIREALPKMNTIILLRNCHPQDRSSFAISAYRAGMISKEQAKEFAISAYRAGMISKEQAKEFASFV